MAFKSYKEESKTNWGVELTSDGNLSRDQIQLGAILRIADATEAMAQSHNKLLSDNEYLRTSCKSNRVVIEKLYRSNASLKGVITKLKKQIDKQE